MKSLRRYCRTLPGKPSVEGSKARSYRLKKDGELVRSTVKDCPRIFTQGSSKQLCWVLVCQCGSNKEHRATSKCLYSLGWPSAAVPAPGSISLSLLMGCSNQHWQKCCCVSTTQQVASVHLKCIFCYFSGLVCVLLCEIQWSVA